MYPSLKRDDVEAQALVQESNEPRLCKDVGPATVVSLTEEHDSGVTQHVPQEFKVTKILVSRVQRSQSLRICAKPVHSRIPPQLLAPGRANSCGFVRRYVHPK